MLKAWKDSSLQPHSVHPGSWQSCELGEFGVNDPIESSSVGLTPEANSNGAVSLKRTRQSSNQDTDIHSIPSLKKAKTFVPHSAHQKHSSSAFTSASAGELLEVAKTRNSKFARNVKRTFNADRSLAIVIYGRTDGIIALM